MNKKVFIRYYVIAFMVCGLIMGLAYTYIEVRNINREMEEVERKLHMIETIMKEEKKRKQAQTTYYECVSKEGVISV